MNGAPTPAAYPSGPTPGASAQTPGAGLSYQTPGVYAGAATAAAEPLEYHERNQNQKALPKDWVVKGVRVIVEQSDFQENRLIGQYGERFLFYFSRSSTLSSSFSLSET